MINFDLELITAKGFCILYMSLSHAKSPVKSNEGNGRGTCDNLGGRAGGGGGGEIKGIVYSYMYTYILLHDWEGNTGEYSVRGWQLYLCLVLVC